MKMAAIVVVLCLANSGLTFGQRGAKKRNEAPRSPEQGQTIPPKAAPAPPLEEPGVAGDIKEISVGFGGVLVSAAVSGQQSAELIPFKLGGHIPVRVYLEGGRVYADVTVWGGPGRPAIDIKKNRFVSTAPNWDRNSNATAMEVVNENGVPMLQLVRTSPSGFHIQGIFFYPGGLMIATESAVKFNPTLPLTVNFKRLFKYPSWEYPGRLDQPTPQPRA